MLFAVVDQPSRRLWEEEYQERKNGSGDNLKTERDTPLFASGEMQVGTIDCPCCVESVTER